MFLNLSFILFLVVCNCLVKDTFTYVFFKFIYSFLLYFLSILKTMWQKETIKIFVFNKHKHPQHHLQKQNKKGNISF